MEITMNFTIKTLARLIAIIIMSVSLILFLYGAIKFSRVETAETIFSNIQISTPGVTVTSSLSEKTKNNAQIPMVGSLIGFVLGTGGLILTKQLANSSSSSEHQENEDSKT